MIASTDAAFAVHEDTGGSHFSLALCISHDSASFHVLSRVQRTKISLNPRDSEYSGLSESTELVKFDRIFLAWIFFPQDSQTIIETDSAPSIATVVAPSFPRHSKNLLVENRNVRAAIAAGVIHPVHVLS